MSDRRLALEAIAYGENPRITPGDRMKALEMLAATEAAGEVSLAMAKVLAEVEQLTGDELDAELAGFMAAGWQPTEEEVMQQEVETRFRRAVRALGRSGWDAIRSRVVVLALSRLPVRERSRRSFPLPHLSLSPSRLSTRRICCARTCAPRSSGSGRWPRCRRAVGRIRCGGRRRRRPRSCGATCRTASEQGR